MSMSMSNLSGTARRGRVFHTPGTCQIAYKIIISGKLIIFLLAIVNNTICSCTQVNRMSRSRRVLAIGGKQRILRLDMVCIETILFHLDSL